MDLYKKEVYCGLKLYNMKQVFAEAFEHKNVHGKPLKYVRFKSEIGELVINVGDSTFMEVNRLAGYEETVKELFSESMVANSMLSIAQKVEAQAEEAKQIEGEKPKKNK